MSKILHTSELFEMTGCLSLQGMRGHLANKLSPSDGKIVNAHLAECELCADALGGIEMMPQDKIVLEGVAAINAQVRAKTTGGEAVAPLNRSLWYSVAAAMVLLIISGTFFIIQEDAKKMDQIFTQNFENKPPPSVERSSGEVETEKLREEVVSANTPKKLAALKDQKVTEQEQKGKKGVNTDVAETKKAQFAKSTQVEKSNLERASSKATSGVKAEDPSPSAKKNFAGPPPSAPSEPKLAEEIASDEELDDLEGADDWGDEEFLASNQDPGMGGEELDARKEVMQDIAVEDEITGGYRLEEAEEEAVVEEPVVAAYDFDDQAVVGNMDLRDKSTIIQEEEKQAKPKGGQLFKAKKDAPSRARSSDDNLYSYSQVSPTTMVQSGMDYYNREEYENAILQFEQVLNQNPDQQEALLYCAISYMNLDRPQKAVPLLDSLVKNESGPYYEDGQWYKALALVKLKKKQPAKILLQQLESEEGPYQKRSAKLLKDF